MVGRRILFALCVVAAAGAHAAADDVTVKKMPPYDDVTVTGVKEGRISFLTSSGSTITKPVIDVSVIRLKGNDEYNQAEKLMADGKPDIAVTLFNAAYRQAAGGTWLKSLIRYRRLMALDQQGALAKAVDEWLEVTDEKPTSEALLGLQPKNFAATAEGDAAKAAAVLEAKIPKIADKAYLQAARGVLLGVYKAAGMDDKAQRLAREIGGLPATEPAAGAAAASPSSAAAPGDQTQSPLLQTAEEGGVLGEILPKAEARITAGAPAEAADLVRSNLGRLGMDELPPALMLLGKASYAAAQKGPADRKKQALLDAGLNYMRVVTYFPETAEAAEALYMAGKVNAALGNAAAAARAYEAVMTQYPTADAAKLARTALDESKKK